MRGRAGTRLRILLVVILATGCANDLILEYGKGDSVRLVGHADNFDCDDPAYAAMSKVETFTIVLGDGTVKRLCRPQASSSAPKVPVARYSTSKTGEKPPSAERPPRASEFFFKVENLIDNVADVDVRRFTIVAPAGRRLKFHIGTAGTTSQGMRSDNDPADVRRLEAVLVVRLRSGPAATLSGMGIKTVHFIKFNRERGHSVETDNDTPGRTSLKDVIAITTASGYYPIEQELWVGKVDGKDLIVSVE